MDSVRRSGNVFDYNSNYQETKDAKTDGNERCKEPQRRNVVSVETEGKVCLTLTASMKHKHKHTNSFHGRD